MNTRSNGYGTRRRSTGASEPLKSRNLPVVPVAFVRGSGRARTCVGKLGASDVVDFGGWVVSVWRRLF